MERGRAWAVDPSKLETFNKLGQREQKAVGVVLRGIQGWETTKIEPRPMRARVTPDSPFNLKEFANVLHEMGIGIVDSVVQDEKDPNVVTFQPRPYSKDFMSGDPDILKVVEEEYARLMKDLSPELLQWLR